MLAQVIANKNPDLIGQGCLPDYFVTLPATVMNSISLLS
jgi:hypothetical protein